MSRTVAIKTGGDWWDAAVCHVDVPEDVSLEEAETAWRESDYIRFADYLVAETGAEWASSVESYRAG